MSRGAGSRQAANGEPRSQHRAKIAALQKRLTRNALLAAIKRERAQRLLFRSRLILSRQRRRSGTTQANSSSTVQNAAVDDSKLETASNVEDEGKPGVKKTRRSSVWKIGDLPNPKQPFELEKTKFFEVYFGGGTARRRRFAENLDQLMYDDKTCPPINTDEKDLHFANAFLNALKAYLPEASYWELINRLSSFQLLAEEEIKTETSEEEVAPQDELAFNIYRSVAEMVEDAELLELLTGFLTEHQASSLNVHDTWRDITEVRNFVEKVRTQIPPEVRKNFWRQCGKMATSLTPLSSSPQTMASASTSSPSSSPVPSATSSPIASRVFETFARALRHKPYLLTELLRLSPYHKPSSSLRATAPDFEVIRLGDDPAVDASSEDLFEEVTAFAHEDRANCPCPCHAGRTARTRHCSDCGLRVLGGQLMWDNANVVVHFPRPPEATLNLGESVGSTGVSHSPRRKATSTGDLLSVVCTAVGRDRASLREMALRSWSEQCRQRRNSDPPVDLEVVKNEQENSKTQEQATEGQEEASKTQEEAPMAQEAQNGESVENTRVCGLESTSGVEESNEESAAAQADEVPHEKTGGEEVVEVKTEPVEEETREWCMEEDAELLTYLQTKGISEAAFEELTVNSSHLKGRHVTELHRRFEYLMGEYQRTHGNTDGEASWNQWEDKILLEYCQANGSSTAAFEAVSRKLDNQRTPANLKRRFKALMRFYMESNQEDYDSDAFGSDN